jgi:hypothetical protein
MYYGVTIHYNSIGGNSSVRLAVRRRLAYTAELLRIKVQTFRTLYFEPEKVAPRIRQTHNSSQLKLEYLQEIINDKAPSRIDRVVIDACSAQIVLQAYSAIGKVLQRRFLAMSVESIVNTTSKLTKG